MLKTVNQVLEDLIETVEDGKKGFREAADHLDEERPDIARRMREFADERERFSAELREIAAAEGLEIVEDGSIAGAVHRGWISIKDALSSNDTHAVLAAAETGEDHAVEEFEAALGEELPAGVREIVARQAAAVRDAHDAVKALRDGQEV